MSYILSGTKKTISFDVFFNAFWDKVGSISFGIPGFDIESLIPDRIENILKPVVKTLVKNKIGNELDLVKSQKITSATFASELASLCKDTIAEALVHNTDWDSETIDTATSIAEGILNELFLEAINSVVSELLDIEATEEETEQSLSQGWSFQRASGPQQASLETNQYTQVTTGVMTTLPQKSNIAPVAAIAGVGVLAYLLFM